jgi:rhomboid protease GluP
LSFAILVAIAFAYAALAAAGGSLTVGAATLIAFGGNFAPLVTGGEWWRLVANVFLHAGPAHLAMNALALFFIGPLVERLFGPGRYALLYFGSGTAGSIASIFWRQNVVSVGASGAIFGLYGALLAYLAWCHGSLPSAARRGLLASAAAFVGYSLAFGAGSAGIDNAAHAGGLIGGALLGTACARSPAASRRRFGEWLRTGAAALLAAIFIAALLHATPDTSADYRQAVRLERAIEEFGREEQALSARLRALQDRLKQRRSSETEALGEVENDLIPGWDAQLARLSHEGPAGSENEILRQSLVRYAALRRDSLALLARAIRLDDPRLAELARVKFEQANDVIAAVHERAAEADRRER